jgi:hypothetical protein
MKILEQYFGYIKCKETDVVTDICQYFFIVVSDKFVTTYCYNLSLVMQQN